MTTTSRPDRLPLARPSRIGLPSPGAVIGSSLALPNGGTLYYPYGTTGDTWVLKNSLKANGRPPTAEELADDTAKGRTWQDYAIVAAGRQIGPVDLGSMEFVYVDTAGNNWLMEVSYTVATYTLTAKVYVRRRFGILPHNNQADPYGSVLAGQGSFTLTFPAWYGGSASDAATYLASLNITSRDLDFTEDGHSATWNVRTSAYIPGAGIGFDLIGWFTIAMAGAGSTNPAMLGQGISATVTGHGLSDVYETYNEATTNSEHIVMPTTAVAFYVITEPDPPPSPPPPGTDFEWEPRIYDSVSQSFEVPEYELERTHMIVQFVFADGVKAKTYSYTYEHDICSAYVSGNASATYLGGGIGWESCTNDCGAYGYYLRVRDVRGSLKLVGNGINYEIGTRYAWEESSTWQAPVAQPPGLYDNPPPCDSSISAASSPVDTKNAWTMVGGSETLYDMSGWSTWDWPSTALTRKTNNVWQVVLEYYEDDGVLVTDGYLVTKNGDETDLPVGTNLGAIKCSWNPETNDMEWRDSGSSVQWI